MPQATAGFHRRSSIQALGFIVEVVVAFLVVGFSVDPSFGFFFSLLWTSGGGGGGGGSCGYG